MKKILFILAILITETLSIKAQSKDAFTNNLLANRTIPKTDFVFAVIVQQKNVTCYGGNNGYVVVYSLGGTRPYTYSWSPSVGNSIPLDTIDLAGGMTAGTYTCTISDATAATFHLTVTITQPPKLMLTTVSSVNEKCYGENIGSITVAANGGIPSYSYAWSPSGSTTTSANNLFAGNYIITVTDSNKCTAKDTVMITQPAAIATSATVIPSSCSTSNGSLSISASNGILPYSYLWTPGGYTTNSISGLSAGSYTCTVTDSLGCKVKSSSIVTDSTTLTASLVNSANVKCYGDNNGLAAFSVTGGLGHDTYLWSPTGGTTTSAAGLYAGTYSFTATDSVGCKSLSIITILQPKLLHDSMTNIRNIACYGGTTGRVTVGVAGGTQPYSYVWSTGATTATLNGLTAGTFTVKVTDSHGCVDSSAISLTQPSAAVGDSNHVSNIACYGGTANATVYAFGGVHPYTYAWAPGGNTTNSASGLTPGTYVVTVRDSNNCRRRDTIVITQPPSFIIGNDTLLSYPCNNKAWVQVTGNLSDYTFSWSPSGGTQDTATGLCAGAYIVTITNSTGCVEHDTITIISTSGIQQYSLDKNITIYPIPAKDQINFSIKDNSFELSNISVFDITGKEVFAEKIKSNTCLQTIDVSEFSEGTYFLKLTGKSIKIVKFFVAGR